MRADEAKPMLLRLARYGMALCDFLWTGTVFRYFGASWQYGSFFFYPLAYLIAFALTGALLGRAAAALLGLDDWIFSWDYLHGRRFDVEARLNQFAQELVDAARDRSCDEIVVVGHSLGATLAVNVVARARRDVCVRTLAVLFARIVISGAIGR